MTTPEPVELLPIDATVALVEFARTCKAAARAVSLYPAEHPAIRGALARVEEAARRITAAASVTIAVLPDSLTIDGRLPAKADATIGELAAMLHERLVGELRIEREAGSADWRALLLLLSRPADELLADGGIARAWAATGQAHFSIREIDYAEVLRERQGAEGAAWTRILEFCLQGRTDVPLDDHAIDVIIEALGDPAKLSELLERVQTGSAGGADLAARVAALLQIIRQVVDVLRARLQDPGPVLQALADSAGQMTPDMILSLISHARQQTGVDAPPAAAEIVERISDNSIAEFVSRSVVAEQGATERLALAFGALVPDQDRKSSLLDLARANAAASPVGADAGFEDMWRNAAEMLTSYSDKNYVSDEYGRELSGTRTRAIDVEAVSDDPPDRVQAWLTSVNVRGVRELDLALIRDLLRESSPEDWQGMASVAHVEIERRTSVGDFGPAQDLLEALVAAGDEGRAVLREAATVVLERLATGPVVQDIVEHLRRADDAGVALLTRMCQTIGASIVRPLAIALAAEENARAIRRLRDLLLSFGAAGRQSVEALKHSPNPAVRRTAIDLLRVFGGHEALPELASMLDDADPQVQRESIRAIVQIGTEQAFAVLEQALVGGNSEAGRTILQQLIGLRDERSIPLLCYVLRHTTPRGALTNVHAQIVDTLGGLPAHSESARALGEVLHSGTWWAPFRTAALRRGAAAALHRLGSPDAQDVLREAAERGSYGVRKAARQFAPSSKDPT